MYTVTNHVGIVVGQANSLAAALDIASFCKHYKVQKDGVDFSAKHEATLVNRIVDEMHTDALEQKRKGILEFPRVRTEENFALRIFNGK